MNTLAERISGTAAQTAKQYGAYVTTTTVAYELINWADGRGEKHLKALTDAGDDAGINQLLEDVARRYAEGVKARSSGYSPDDVAYYSLARLADIVPLALDKEWDGLTGETDSGGRGSGDAREGGVLLAMVVDVRRALGGAVDWATPADFDPESEEGLGRLRVLQDRLGGGRPVTPGYRGRNK